MPPEFETQPAIAEQEVAQPSAPIEQIESTGATDTPETVAETDEQKNQRLLAEREQRSKRRQDAIQRRFDEMAAEKHELRRQVDLLIQAQTRGQQSVQQPKDGPLVRGPDEDYESWVVRKAEWGAEQKASKAVEAKLAALEKTQTESRLREQATQVRSQFESRLQTFAKAQPDWDDVVANNDEVNIPDEAVGLIHIDPDGPAILYAIGKNPALAAQLRGSVVQQAMVLGQIKASLKASPQVSKAPPPGQPVGSRGGPTEKDPKSMSRDEYYAHITRRRGGKH